MHWLDVLGWGGSALLVYSLMQARVFRFRVLNLVACVVLVVFNAILEIWPMVAMNVVLSGINLYFIRRLVSDRHDDKAFEVLEVGPNDEYLRYVLRVHGKDILEHQPGLVWDGAAPGHRAYLVQHANETVGVVLARESEDGGLADRARLRDTPLPRLLPRRVRLASESATPRTGLQPCD